MASGSENDVRAVVRALTIFDAFDREHTSLSLQEICNRIGMPKATTFRLVNTVCRAGFLVRLADQRYCLSPKLARLGSMVHSTLSIRDVALPVMIDVNRATRETITLNVAAGGERICLEVVDTPSPLMTIVRPGEHVPLLYGATARILMAHMSEEERERVIAASPDAAKLDRVALDRDLKRFRSQGYSLTRNQRVQGVTAIAVPLHDPSSKELYCLALTGPSVRVDPRDGEYVEMMLAAGEEISNLLGAAPAPSPTPKARPARAPVTPEVAKPAKKTNPPKAKKDARRA